jgi:galactokinase
MDTGTGQNQSIDDPRLQAGFVPPDPDLTASVRRRFRSAFNGSPELLVVAPGRIEIVGNHLDYNGGDVIAAAVDRWVTVAGRNRTDGRFQVVPGDISSRVATFSTDDNDLQSGSSDAVRAAVAALQAAGVGTTGADLFYRGTIPTGIGLSSSSALLVALTSTLADLAGANLPRLEIARIAMDAEHRTGAPVGLMDHTSSVVGGILRFSNDARRVRVLDAHLGDAVFALIDSGVRHGMPGSRYAMRVEECQNALMLLREAGFTLAALADLPPESLKDAEGVLPDQLANRLRHVVEEVARTGEAYQALEAGDLQWLGEIMTASGRSSATHYDISHPAVEAAAAAARSVPGVYGARMMGGGDGGSAIALVDREAVPALMERLPSNTVTVCRIARGMMVLRDA